MTSASRRRLAKMLDHLPPATIVATAAAPTGFFSQQKRVAMKDERSPDPLDPLPSTPEHYNVKGCGQVGLTQEEADHFREFGFIIKRGLIPREALQPFVDLWWEQPPVIAAGISREDTSTWVQPGKRWPADQRWATSSNWLGVQPWPGPEDARPAATVGARVGRQPHGCGGNGWKWHGLGHDPDFVNATSAHPNMLHVVEALLGGPVRRPRRNRGCYTVFPRSDRGVDAKLGPHNDGAPTELMAVTNLTEVSARSGGFTIWPTSPQQLYPTSKEAYNWVATPASRQAMDRIRSTVTPLEFVGGPGDVVLAHGLIVHSAGLQQSENQIRRAIVQDFNKVRARGPLRWTAAGKAGGKGAGVSRDGLFVFPTDDPDPADGNREVTTPWHHDGNEWVADARPPLDDMWAEWNLGKSTPIGDVVDEPAWWEKYDLPMLPDPGTQRGGGGCPAVRLDQIANYEGGGVWRVRHRGEDWLQV